VHSDFGVYLESLQIRDADSIAENANDYELARGVGLSHFPHPYGRSDALAFIERATAAFAGGIETHFGIHMDDGTLIGILGLSGLDKADRKGEAGYWLGRKYWGKGYGKKAVRLLLHFGFEDISLNRISALVYPFNETSAKLLRGLGFQKEGTLREASTDGKIMLDADIFALLKKDYREDADIVTEGFDAGSFAH
jgi:RimJ/RimL family protein N-acetyltransferase